MFSFLKKWPEMTPHQNLYKVQFQEVDRIDEVTVDVPVQDAEAAVIYALAERVRLGQDYHAPIVDVILVDARQFGSR